MASTTCLIAGLGVAAGPMGHNALAMTTVERILNGSYEAPEDLKELLKSPQMQQMFAGGSIGPDLFPTKTHRGDQSKFTHSMLSNARQRFEAAKRSGNQDDQRRAGEDLAFAYGWLSHVAVDLEVHPVVNGVTGDAYDHNNEGEKLTHSALEAQLYAYLKRVAKQNQAFEAKIPYDFVAQTFGIDESDVRRATARLRLIAAGEIASANQVTLTDKQLKEIWGNAVSESLVDTRMFLKDASTFENWDLDVGKMSTEEFEWLRNAVEELNGGALPKDWGKRYLSLWNLVKDLPPSEHADRLAREFANAGGGGASWGDPSGVPGLALSMSKERRGMSIEASNYRWPKPFVAPPKVPVKWDGAKFSWSVAIDEGAPYLSEIEVSGELASDRAIKWIKVKNIWKDTSRNLAFTNLLEAKNLLLETGLYDERVGDVTFCVWNADHSPSFSGSLTKDGKLETVWDRTNVKEWSESRRPRPLIVVRFRPFE